MVSSKTYRQFSLVRIHQRNCRVVKGFNDEQLFEVVNDADLENNVSHAEIPLEEHFDIKPGIRLPRSNQEWLLANKYFHSTFSNISVNASTVDPVIQLMNKTIYDYFKDTCGTSECCNEDLKEKYANLTSKNLKKELRTLKHSNAPLKLKSNMSLTFFVIKSKNKPCPLNLPI